MTDDNYTRSLESALALSISLDKNTAGEAERSISPETGLVKIMFSGVEIAGFQLTTDGYLITDEHRAWPHHREEKDAQVQTSDGSLYPLSRQMTSWPGVDVMILKADIPADPKPIPYNVALGDVKYDPLWWMMNKINFIGIRYERGILTEKIKGKITGDIERSDYYSTPDWDTSFFAHPTDIPNHNDYIGGIFIGDTGDLRGIAIPVKPNYMLIPIQTMQDCIRKAGISRSMELYGLNWKIPVMSEH